MNSYDKSYPYFTHEKVYSFPQSGIYHLLYFKKEGLLISGGSAGLSRTILKTGESESISSKGVNALIKWGERGFISSEEPGLISRSLDTQDHIILHRIEGYKNNVGALAPISSDRFAALTLGSHVLLLSYSQRKVLRQIEGEIVGPGYAFFTRIIPSKKYPGCVLVNPTYCNSGKKDIIKMIDFNDLSEDKDPIIKIFRSNEELRRGTTIIRTYVQKNNEIIVTGTSKLGIIMFYDIISTKCFKKFSIRKTNSQIRSMEIIVNGNDEIFLLFGCINAFTFNCYKMDGSEIFEFEHFSKDGITQFYILDQSKVRREIRIASSSYDKNIRITKLEGLPVEMFRDESSEFEVLDLKERVEYLRDTNNGLFDGIDPYLRIKLCNLEILKVCRTFL